ncbi:chitin synthase-domain-containing protein, partial [Blyttiomyces helicus]
IVSDGRAKINPNVLKVLEVMGIYQDGIAQASVNGKDTTAHIFEYTAQSVLDPKLQQWGAKEGIPPMQTIFCLKEKNAKKINSHRWFFNAFSAMIEPRVCVLIDVGTKPSEESLYSLWKAFFRNDQIAGACGEIRADLGSGLTYFKSICNPLIASQNFEYKISNVLDKSLESAFGYISVLPGAFSAYRYKALLNIGPGQGPLAKYFEGEQRAGVVQDSSIFSANLYLAEDRILCFELVAKRNAAWTLHYVSRAKADTDVPDSIPEFLSQRRRWLNGSLFAGYVKQEPRRSKLSPSSPLTLPGNFAVTFYYLFNELQDILSDPTSGDSSDVRNRIVNIILDAARYSYPVVLVCLFIISFGNRPQAFHGIYKAVMIGFGLIGAVMLGLIIRRVVVMVNTSTDSSADTNYATFFEQQTWLYVITLASTVGVFWLASFLHMDFAHMFTSFLQYLLLLPSYINVLTVYALSNLHDVSWGTKGDSKAEVLPAVRAIKEKDGTVVADVSVAANRADLSRHFQESLADLHAYIADPTPTARVDPKTQQEDDYKGFRTYMLLVYLGSNGLLFGIATGTGANGLYLSILLFAVAGISAVKLLGVFVYMGMKLFTETMHCCDRRSARGEWRKTNKGWTPRRGRSRSPAGALGGGKRRGRGDGGEGDAEMSMLDGAAPHGRAEGMDEKSLYGGSQSSYVAAG